MFTRFSFGLWTSCLLILSACLFIFIFPVDGKIDLYLIQPWIDHAGHFPLKNDWFLATLSHSYVKKLITLVYISFFLLWCASFKLEKLKARRWQYGYMFWVSMLCTCMIGLFKAHSGHACPWDMTHATTTGFVWNFSSTTGHCFPGGHASTGFALITGYFVYRLDQPKRAYFYLYAAMILGFAMGWAQMMRGAHFLSHNLWTMWWCFAINWGVYMLYSMAYKWQALNANAHYDTDVIK